MPEVLVEEVRDRWHTIAERSPHPRAAASNIALFVGEAVGLCDRRGVMYTESVGGTTVPRMKKDARYKPADFHPERLAEGIIGPDWKRQLGLETSGSIFPYAEWMSASDGGQKKGGWLKEEATTGMVPPSVMANVAAWSATVGGLFRAEFNLGYEQADYDVWDLFPIRNAVFWQGGERMVDIFGPYSPAPAVGPGEQYPAMGIDAMWVEPAPMKKYAGVTTVPKETAAIDISSGRILAAARQAGETLAFRENENTLDVITGQNWSNGNGQGNTGNNWKLGMLTDGAATAYNTYGPTITNVYGTAVTIQNDLVNPLNDLGALQKSDEAIANLLHPRTGLPINVNMDRCILPTPLSDVGRWLLGMGDWSALNQTTAGPAQGAPGTFPNSIQAGRNPYQNVLKPIGKNGGSRWLHFRQTASTVQQDTNRAPGLGLAGAAQYRWYRLDPSKFACRRQFWPRSMIDVSPNDWVMATQGLIAGHAFDMTHQVQVLNPYAIQRNKSQ